MEILLSLLSDIIRILYIIPSIIFISSLICYFIINKYSPSEASNHLNYISIIGIMFPVTLKIALFRPFISSVFLTDYLSFYSGILPITIYLINNEILKDKILIFKKTGLISIIRELIFNKQIFLLYLTILILTEGLSVIIGEFNFSNEHNINIEYGEGYALSKLVSDNNFWIPIILIICLPLLFVFLSNKRSV